MLEQARPVKFISKLRLLKFYPALAILGFIFTLMPVFLTILFTAIFSTIDNGVSTADYEKIKSHGTSTKGTITNVETEYNVTINNQHPTIITYQYTAGGTTTSSTFETLDPDRVSRLKPGDEINITYLDSQSILTEFEPFAFPINIFYGVAASFLPVGLICLGILYFKTKKRLDLYRYGRVKDAQVVSVVARSSSRGRRNLINIHYKYQTSFGQPELDSSTSDDLTLLNKKQGDAILIFVDRNDERKSCLIPALDAVENGWNLTA